MTNTTITDDQLTEWAAIDYDLLPDNNLAFEASHYWACWVRNSEATFDSDTVLEANLAAPALAAELKKAREAIELQNTEIAQLLGQVSMLRTAVDLMLAPSPERPNQ